MNAAEDTARSFYSVPVSPRSMSAPAAFMIDTSDRILPRIVALLSAETCKTSIGTPNTVALIRNSRCGSSYECTFSAVRSVGCVDGDMGTHRPTAIAWNSGRMLFALGWPRLSSKSLLYQPARKQTTWTSQG